MTNFGDSKETQSLNSHQGEPEGFDKRALELSRTSPEHKATQSETFMELSAQKIQVDPLSKVSKEVITVLESMGLTLSECIGNNPTTGCLSFLAQHRDSVNQEPTPRVVKLYAPILGSDLELASRCCARERKTLTACSTPEHSGHQALPRILKHGEIKLEEGIYSYNILEHISGTLLSERLTDSAFPYLSEQEAWDILGGVTKSLCALHGKGFVHRDLKPEHILKNKAGTYCLLDVNASKEEAEDTHTLLRSTGWQVTPPDSVASQYRAHSDLYTLGAMVLGGLLGKPPYELMHSDVGLHGYVDCKKLEARRDVSAALKQAINHLCDIDESSRPESALEASGTIATLRGKQDSTFNSIASQQQRVNSIVAVSKNQRQTIKERHTQNRSDEVESSIRTWVDRQIERLPALLSELAKSDDDTIVLEPIENYVGLVSYSFLESTRQNLVLAFRSLFVRRPKLYLDIRKPTLHSDALNDFKDVLEKSGLEVGVVYPLAIEYGGYGAPTSFSCSGLSFSVKHKK